MSPLLVARVFGVMWAVLVSLVDIGAIFLKVRLLFSFLFSNYTQKCYCSKSSKPIV